MRPIYDLLMDQAVSIIAAAFGAFLSLPFMRGARPLTAVVAVFSGVGCAYYFTPWIAHVFNMSMSSFAAIAFIIGFCGMQFLTGVMRLLESWAQNPLASVQKVLRAWRGK